MTLFIENDAEITNKTQLARVLAGVIQQLGFDAGSLIYAPVGELPNKTPGQVHPIISVGFEQSPLIDHWIAGTERDNPLSHIISPTWRLMLGQTLPKHFDLKQQLEQPEATHSIAEKQWLKALIDLGFSELCMVPVHFPDKTYFALSCLKLSRESDHSGTTDLSGAADFSSQMLANLLYCTHKLSHICLHYNLIDNTNRAHNSRILSPREQECLHWSAQGKSAIETADILDLHPETVRTYIKSLLKKLNAANKAQAISIGYEIGLLGGGR